MAILQLYGESLTLYGDPLTLYGSIAQGFSGRASAIGGVSFGTARPSAVAGRACVTELAGRPRPSARGGIGGGGNGGTITRG